MKRLVTQAVAFFAVAALAATASGNDEQIAKQIISKLRMQQQAANLQGFDLGVQVDKGTVTMMGQVANTEQAMLALDIARRVQGVRLVVNDLYIKSQRTADQPQAPAQVQQQSIQAQPVSVQAQPAPQAALTVEAGLPVPQATIAAAVAAPASPAPVQSILMQQPAIPAVAAAYQGAAVGTSQSIAQRPVPFAPSTSIRTAAAQGHIAQANYHGDVVVGDAGASYGAPGYGSGAVMDNPSMPGYAWPSYSAHPNYGSVSYPQQYSATAWPYIGPFYPYPQVPLGWRKVTLEWDDGWWFLDFKSK